MLIDPNDNILRPCPKCRKPNHVETRICVCGFLFTKPEVFQQTSGLQQLKREKLRRSIKKYLVLAGFVFLCGSVAAFWGGFIDIPGSSEADKETKSLSNEGVPRDGQKTSTNRRSAKGTIEGTVIAVSSGDTITVLDTNNQKYEIKLGEIETPGPDQDFGLQAKENLEALVLDKSVTVYLQRIEDSGLHIGKVLFNGNNINLEQMKAGFARQNKDSASLQTEDDRRLYEEAENTAKIAKIGLWSNADPNLPAEVADNAVVNPDNNAKNLADKDSTTRKTEPGLLAAVPTESLATQPTTQSDESSADNRTMLETLPPRPFVVSQPTPGIIPPNPPISATKATVSATSATARCGDGSFSYSAGRGGACSNHGGVAVWLNGSNYTKPDTSGKKAYIMGSRGGFYYINSNGKKTYVDQSLCK